MKQGKVIHLIIKKSQYNLIDQANVKNCYYKININANKY